MRLSLLTILFAVLGTGLGHGVSAALADDDHHDHDVAIGDIHVIHAFIAAVPAGGDGVIFFEIDNEGSADRLLEARAEGFEETIISGFTLHNGVPGWQRVGAMDIPTGMTAFDAGGLGIRVHGAHAAFVAGDSVALDLVFAQAGTGVVRVEVLEAGATTHPHHGHQH